MESNNKGLIIGLVVIVILAIIFLLLGGTTAPNETGTTQEINGQNAPTDLAGDISQVDLESARTPEEKLPAGFPTNLPVNTDSITDSFNVEYDDTGAREASVIFTSSTSIGDLRAQYVTYFEENGYTLDQDDLTDQDALLSASKDGDVISIAIIELEGGQEVFVSVITQ